MRANKTTTRIGWIVAMALSGASAAQEVHPVLAKGKVVEEAEHDLEGAARLYAQVAQDGSLGPVVRADAFLRLASVRARLGDMAGARAALESAAEGKGAAAEEAKRRLASPQDPNAADGSVNLEILRLMTVVREWQGDTAALQALDEIAWYGERAVPLLVEAVKTERDFGFVTYCARGLLKIGGPKVETWIGEATRYEDALRRRAVARAADAERARVEPRKLAAFLEDPAAEVRLQAVESGVLADWEQALQRVEDDDVRVRRAAFRWLTPNFTQLREGALPEPARRRSVIEGMIDVAGERIVDVENPTTLSHRITVAVGSVSGAEDRLALAMHLARARALPMTNTPYAIGLTGDLSTPRPTANVLVDETLATARALRGLDREGADAMRMELFDKAREHAVATWNRASMAAALELLELGFGFDVEWFGRHLQPADWIVLFERLESFEHVPGYSSAFLTRQLDRAIEVELPSEAFEPLRRWFEAKAASPGADTMWLHRALVRLGKFGTEESARWSMRMLTGGLAELEVTGQDAEALRSSRDGLFQGLISSDSPATVAALRQLAVVEGAEHAALRNMALSRLVWLHDVEAAPLFARAYELGIERTPMYFAWGAPQTGQYNLIGLGWIEASPYVTSTSNQQPWPKTVPWTDAEKALAIGPSLALGIAQPWEDSWSMVNAADPGSAVHEVAIRNWSACPDGKLKDRYFKVLSVGAPGEPMRLVRRLVIDALGDPTSGIRHEALSRIHARSSRYVSLEWGDDLARAVIACLEFGDERIVAEALSQLGRSGDAELEAVLVKHLDHDSSAARRAAVSALFDLVPDRALDLTFGTLRDPGMRITMTGIAKQTLDRRFVPLLIDALRDESETVRARAKESLDAIEFFVSQEQRWKRLLSDAGLESGNAAEALLKQAREAGDKRIRLAAIQSLGTLAVPETLPFLIQLMQDEDAEIVAAAATAIERINR